ncbi:hypothetical protein [Verrucosispora sp. WMMD573]|nr:hypothetical protein [Verrucosispora sp. WMMD573]WBB54035.1 hypothetical protein O7601_26390 [Verrucosispora sp. WMMD573]
MTVVERGDRWQARPATSSPAWARYTWRSSAYSIFEAVINGLRAR